MEKSTSSASAQRAGVWWKPERKEFGSSFLNCFAEMKVGVAGVASLKS